ncbi:protein CDV3 homolog [Mizuhopecten yessoensis]|uniref:Protein CDV3-like n=1 Tax=Mizuhopecten yessoensis TaxID=6573 RepID=A0A210Q1N2_MIZYE|nr:protein CDV3 homolog [Mizuhopecten yessoensis]OWF42632.1 Protein CDV3-like [Mizuhopecten yessoensis]
MADSSLDDFFAKKDKGKKKNKSKTTPSDILSKHDNFVPEDNTGSQTTKSKKKKKDKENAATSNSDSTNTGNVRLNKEDEEWVDYEDEAEKDYSGLRIQNLQIKNKEEEVEEDDKDNENDEDGESGEKRDTSGPWNTSQSGKPRAEVKKKKKKVEVEEAPPTPAEEPSKEEAPKAPTKYVPPGARGSQGSGDSDCPSRAAMMRRKKGAPNLKSEDDFPTLGGGAPEVAAWGPSGVGNFERVQGGGKQMDDSSKANMQVSLGNKYAALQD